MMEGRAVSIVSHPPERRPRSTTTLFAGCCCCCCCCVHSLGGATGAIIASLRKGKPSPDSLTTESDILKESEIQRSHRYAVRVYWLSLTLCGFLTCVVCTLANPGEPVIGPAIIAGFLPVGQLAASLFSAIYINVRPPVRKDVCLARLGKITLLAFLGGLLGCIGTVLTFMGMK
jgi:hypothetical protein